MSIDNDELRRVLTAELNERLHQGVAILSSQLGELKGQLETHNKDRFAHQWDHELLARVETERKDWERWRSGVDKWRWTITGGMVFLMVEVTIFGAVFDKVRLA